MLAGWRLPKLNDLMTCLEAFLDVMDSLGFPLIVIDLGLFQDRKFAILWHPVAPVGTVVVPL